MGHASLLSWAGIVAASAGISAGAILILRPILVRHLLAHPNARSSHKVPTPQGAGLAVMLAVLAVCALAASLMPPLAVPSLVPVLAAASFLTLLGALDDRHALRVSWRFIGQGLAALAIVLCLPAEMRILPGLLPLGVERALLVVGTVGFVNAVNFLDGLDWMTVAEVVPITLAVAALQALGIVPAGIGLLALALLGAMLGFAIFNKHPASIFLGDAGSLPIGLCLALMLIYVAEANLAAALLLPMYMVADTCDHARPPHHQQGAVPVGAPLAFLSTRGRRRAKRARGDDAHLPARLDSRGACRRREPCTFAPARPRGAYPRRCRHRGDALLARAGPRVTATVLVTGASGFIGKALIGALAGDGYAVRAAARDPSAIPVGAGIERVALPDLSRPVDWSGLLDGVTHVVHLAGLAHSPGVLADDVYTRINALSAGELAQQAARAKIDRLVLVSSVRAQAGLSADHAITETDRPEPTDAYGRSKLEAEQLVAASGANFTVLRPAVVYGPGVKGNIASLATLARTPMPLPFAGLDNRRSLLALREPHRRDLARARLRAGSQRDLPRRRRRADQRRRAGQRHARGAGAPPSPRWRAARRGEAADEVVRQGSRLGAHLGQLRDRSRQADGDRLASRRSPPMTASSP